MKNVFLFFTVFLVLSLVSCEKSHTEGVTNLEESFSEDSDDLEIDDSNVEESVLGTRGISDLLVSPTNLLDTVTTRFNNGMNAEKCQKYGGYLPISLTDATMLDLKLSKEFMRGGASFGNCPGSVVVYIGDTTYLCDIEIWTDSLVQISFENKRPYLKNSYMSVHLILNWQTCVSETFGRNFQKNRIKVVGGFRPYAYGLNYVWSVFGSSQYEVMLQRLALGLTPQVYTPQRQFIEMDSTYVPQRGDVLRRIGSRVDDSERKYSDAVVWDVAAHKSASKAAAWRTMTVYERNLKCTGSFQKKHFDFKVAKDSFRIKPKTGDREFVYFTR